MSFPGGIHFDLVKYWDGRPVQYVCIERCQDGKSLGRIYWCVAFEIAEHEEMKGEALLNTGEAKDISGDVD